MKSIKAFLLFASFFIFHASFAQIDPFEIGVEAGPSLIYMYGNTVIVKNNPWIGVSTGLSFQYNVPKIFSNRVIVSIKTGLSYDRKGEAKTNSPYTNDMGNVIGYQRTNLNLNYLTLPVLAKVSVLLKKEIKFFVDAGPYVSLLAHADETYSVKNYGGPTPGLKKIDCGAQIGIGAAIPIARQFEISIEERTSVGLLNISTRPVINNGNIKTLSSALLVGFNYKFGKIKTRPKAS